MEEFWFQLLNLLYFLYCMIGIAFFIIGISRKEGERVISTKKRLYAYVGGLMAISAIVMAAAS